MVNKPKQLDQILGMEPVTFLMVVFGGLILIGLLLLPFAAKYDKKNKAKKEAAKKLEAEREKMDAEAPHVVLASSIISCPDCGGKVSKEAETCPHCGHVFKKANTSGTSAAGVFIAIILAILFLLWFLPKIMTVEFTITPVITTSK